MKVWGAQSQRFDGIVQAIASSQPAVWKLIDPDSDILRNIKSVSLSTTTIVRIYTGAPTVDDASQHPDPEQYGYDYATLVYSRVQDPSHMDFLESENEPNDHYNNLTEFIKRLNAFLVGFSRRAKELGFRPLGPNFSTGYPEVYVPNTDYQLWPNAWQGLTDGLGAIRASGGALSLHEYDSPDLFRLWSDSKQRGYLVGRYKAVYDVLPSQLRDLPLFITEFGIDWLTQGINGGFWHNRGDDAYQFMIDQSREAWTRIYSISPQLKGIVFFLWGTTDPKFDEYDIRRTTPSIDAFTQFFSEEVSGGIVEPTPAQTVAIVPFLVKASLQGKYGPGGLGNSLYGQYDAVGDGNELWHCWIFLRGGLKVKDGNYADFSGVKLFNPIDGTPLAEPLPWPTGGTPVPPINKRLTTADLPPEFGIVVNSYTPKVGEKFFGLVGAGNFKSGSSVGTQTTLVAVNEQGSPVIGYSLTHAYDQANQKSETFPSPTVGIILGAGSYYTPPQIGGDHFYVSKGASSGSWPIKYPSDEVIAGMPNGQHFEATYTFQLMTG